MCFRLGKKCSISNLWNIANTGFNIWKGNITNTSVFQEHLSLQFLFFEANKKRSWTRVCRCCHVTCVQKKMVNAQQNSFCITDPFTQHVLWIDFRFQLMFLYFLVWNPDRCPCDKHRIWLPWAMGLTLVLVCFFKFGSAMFSKNMFEFAAAKNAVKANSSREGKKQNNNPQQFNLVSAKQLTTVSTCLFAHKCSNQICCLFWFVPCHIALFYCSTSILFPANNSLCNMPWTMAVHGDNEALPDAYQLEQFFRGGRRPANAPTLLL